MRAAPLHPCPPGGWSLLLLATRALPLPWTPVGPRLGRGGLPPCPPCPLQLTKAEVGATPSPWHLASPCVASGRQQLSVRAQYGFLSPAHNHTACTASCTWSLTPTLAIPCHFTLSPDQGSWPTTGHVSIASLPPPSAVQVVVAAAAPLAAVTQGYCARTATACMTHRRTWAPQRRATPVQAR